MSHVLTESDIESINKRLQSLPSGDFAVTSIGAKNYLLWTGGDWDPEYDFAIHEFFANSKADVKKLIDDVNFYKEENQNLKDELEKIKERVYSNHKNQPYS